MRLSCPCEPLRRARFAFKASTLPPKRARFAFKKRSLSGNHFAEMGRVLAFVIGTALLFASVSPAAFSGQFGLRRIALQRERRWLAPPVCWSRRIHGYTTNLLNAGSLVQPRGGYGGDAGLCPDPLRELSSLRTFHLPPAAGAPPLDPAKGMNPLDPPVASGGRGAAPGPRGVSYFCHDCFAEI